jgi:hypothetical protein
MAQMQLFFIVGTTPEAIESGYATVVGVDSKTFPTRIRQGIADGLSWMSGHPYSRADSSGKIIDILSKHFE